jgi:sulfur carrier protein
VIITVNGQDRSVEEGAVVADVLPDDCRGVAVAVNGNVVPRAAHADTALGPGDRVEIVTAVQGG